MVTDSDADGEKQLDKSTEEKRPCAPFHEYREVGRWATGQDSVLEPKQIEHEIYNLMKKFMQTAA